MEMVKFIISLIFLVFGMFVFVSATLGVNRFDKALNRIHAAALGDTLGILFVVIGLLIWKGLTWASGKMLIIVLFFWLASPVCSHVLGLLELETNEEVQERKDLKEEHHENI